MPRPSNVPQGARSVAPGLHQPIAGEHRVVWWDPNKLQLDEEEAMGLRQVKLLQADEGGEASQAGQEAYQRWAGRRRGGAPKRPARR